MSEYTTTVRWQRDGAKFVDGKYSRVHEWEFDGGITVRGSSSPHVVPLPWSSENAIDPEEALVVALSSCHMLAFLYIAAKRGFVVDAYLDRAVGTMKKNEHGKLAITRVVLFPKTTFSGTAPAADELRDLHHAAHEDCFIANSVKTTVDVEL